MRRAPPPWQNQDRKARGCQSNDSECAPGPGAERVNKGRDSCGGRIAEEAKIHAELEIQGNDYREIDYAHHIDAQEVLPVRPEADHREVIDGAGKHDRVLRPEQPEEGASRSSRQSRLNKSLGSKRKGPKISRRSEPAIEGKQRKRRDQAIEFADMQRQAGREVQPIAVPQHGVTDDPIRDRENTERAPQGCFAGVGQGTADPSKGGDRQNADEDADKMQSAIGNEPVPWAGENQVDRRNGHVASGGLAAS